MFLFYFFNENYGSPNPQVFLLQNTKDDGNSFTDHWLPLYGP